MKIFPWKIGATLRRREGSPKRRGPPRSGHARLGESGDNGGGLSSSPRRGEARSCSPRRRTTSPRRRWATPRRACDCLRSVFVACFGSVSRPGL